MALLEEMAAGARVSTGISPLTHNMVAEGQTTPSLIASIHLNNKRAAMAISRTAATTTTTKIEGNHHTRASNRATVDHTTPVPATGKATTDMTGGMINTRMTSAEASTGKCATAHHL